MLGSAAAPISHLPNPLHSLSPPRPCRCLWSSFQTSPQLRAPSARFPVIVSASARGGPEENAGRITVVLGSSRAPDEVKADLYLAMEGINRGIFGATSAKKAEIEGLVQLLESQNPTPNPTDDLQRVDGCWRLLYSTISILGSKRTKLGLRDFISLGDFLQTINTVQGKAINEIKFSVRGFKMLSGQLTVVASFAVASKTRVDIKFESSEILPDQLMNLFQKNYDLLLAIFNPDGWLEITYVDNSLRIGRDDKGNLFILERFKQAAT